MIHEMMRRFRTKPQVLGNVEIRSRIKQIKHENDTARKKYEERLNDLKHGKSTGYILEHGNLRGLDEETHVNSFLQEAVQKARMKNEHASFLEVGAGNSVAAMQAKARYGNALRTVTLDVIPEVRAHHLQSEVHKGKKHFANVMGSAFEEQKESALEHVFKKKHPLLDKAVQGSIEEVSFPVEFDVITANNVFMHVEQYPYHALENLCNSLTVGGVLLLSAFEVEHSSLQKNLKDLHFLKKHGFEVKSIDVAEGKKAFVIRRMRRNALDINS